MLIPACLSRNSRWRNTAESAGLPLLLTCANFNTNIFADAEICSNAVAAATKFTLSAFYQRKKWAPN